MSRLLPTATGYVALCDVEGVAFEFYQPRHIAGGSQGGWWCDLSILSKLPGQEGILHEGRHNLSSLTTKTALSKYLQGRAPDLDWDSVIAQVFLDVILRLREGLPSIVLGNREPRPPTYRIDKLVQDNQFTIWYGEKDSGKSMMALAAAYAVTEGSDILGLPVRPGCVWYLDWETDEDTQAQRLQWLARAAGARVLPPVRYKRMERGLADEVDTLRREMGETIRAATEEVPGLEGAMVIVDSLGFACGGSLKEEEAARQFLAAARTLDCAVLAIGQTRKPQPGEKRRHFSVYGSTFFEYAARSLWRIQASRDTDEPSFDLGFYHEKSNNSRRFRPIGYRVQVDDANETICIRPQDVRVVPELAEGRPLGERLVEALLGGALTVRELADVLETSRGSIEGTVGRLRQSGKVRLVAYDGREARYGAAAPTT